MAGALPLEEITIRTIETKLMPGLYLAGLYLDSEIADCDGRFGGFNFQ